jgi:hypothetical protein
MSFGRFDVTAIETLFSVGFHVVSPWTELDEGNGVYSDTIQGAFCKVCRRGRY